MARALIQALCVGFVYFVATQSYAQDTLNILNWSDYIGPDVVQKFEKATGIKVKYSIMDSEDTLQAKLLTGNSGYDIVFPYSGYMAKQIMAGIYEPLDWSKIPNRVYLDPNIMAKVSKYDPGNKYGVPYLWGSEGLIVNLTLAKKALGGEVPPLNYDLLYKQEYVSKLKSCGVGMLDSYGAINTMLAYMGRDPNSTKMSDIQDAFTELNKTRPFVKVFTNTMINDFAEGGLCISTGWNGDYQVMLRRAKESGKNYDIRYVSPKGPKGNAATGLWATMIGIPKSATHKDAAYKWINFLLSPEIAAETTNAVTYPNAIPESKKMLKPEIAQDPYIYPSEAQLAEYYTYEPVSGDLLRTLNKMWLRYKSGF